MSTINLVATDQWHFEFYNAFIRVARSWQCGSEGRAMHQLLCDQEQLDNAIEEACITSLPPEAAVNQFVAFLFL